MQLLKNRILSQGRCLEGGVLKVDSFINHQMDPLLMREMAAELVRRFSGVAVDKVITIEASGIAPAILVGLELGLPVLFVKKSRPSTMADFYVSSVFSFTKNRTYDICVSKEFICPGERLLFVDDFLANGNAALGVADLASQAGAVISGMGFLIEKGFQDGRRILQERGYRIESLAIIDSLDNGRISVR